jgi:hypothetical protein
VAPAKNIYQKVVYTSAEYLGPAAERFIRRQITTHLDKRPEDITAKDIAELTNWVKQTFALLTENHELVEAFARDLGEIAQSSSTRKTRRRIA